MPTPSDPEYPVILNPVEWRPYRYTAAEVPGWSVTVQNLEQAARWCGGSVQHVDGLEPGVILPDQAGVAYPGDWILFIEMGDIDQYPGRSYHLGGDLSVSLSYRGYTLATDTSMPPLSEAPPQR
jgi:DMSO/TMAO reductase YedYZ molybdopterin-dependent catalytic subunit